jgi:hypothetical protein
VLGHPGRPLDFSARNFTIVLGFFPLAICSMCSAQRSNARRQGFVEHGHTAALLRRRRGQHLGGVRRDAFGPSTGPPGSLYHAVIASREGRTVSCG